MSHIGAGNTAAKCRLKRIGLIKCVMRSLVAVENHWFFNKILMRTL